MNANFNQNNISFKMNTTDDVWISYKNIQERDRKHPNAFMKCNMILKNGKSCIVCPKYYCKEHDIWRCGKHRSFSMNEKDTLKKRAGSIRYSGNMTLTRTNMTYEQLNAYDNDEIVSNRCVYCDVIVSQNMIDHICSLIKTGGVPNIYMTESCYNKVPCCKVCNSSKGNKDAIEWMMSKNCSQEKIDMIQRRINKIPKWDEELYKGMCLKSKVFMLMIQHVTTFCETKITTPENISKDYNHMIYLMTSSVNDCILSTS
jgi:hypothetical protein